jgi:hypothetical protein
MMDAEIVLLEVDVFVTVLVTGPELVVVGVRDWFVLAEEEDELDVLGAVL